MGFGRFLLLAFLSGVVATPYDGYSQLRLFTSERSGLQALANGTLGAHMLGVRHAEGGYFVDMVVPSSALPSLPGKYEVVIGDLGKAFADERATHRGNPWNSIHDDAFFDAFRPYEEILKFIDLLVDEYPFVRKFKVGTTAEGREIVGLKVAREGTRAGALPQVYLQGTVHAREWLATTSLLWVLKEICRDVAGGQTPGEIEWTIVPVVNVDGYMFTWESNRLWRKNRRPIPGSSSVGVDINRNWGPASTWCSAGSSKNPSSDVYCGPSAFSEPETSSARDQLASLPNLKAAIDFHTYGELILYPWQYTYDRIPSGDRQRYIEVGDNMRDAINGVAGARYVNQQGSDLYPHSGGMIDWCYAEDSSVLAYTFEGRGTSFSPPASSIKPAGAESYAGIDVLVTAILS